jgi:hypothetical protein
MVNFCKFDNILTKSPHGFTNNKRHKNFGFDDF